MASTRQYERVSNFSQGMDAYRYPAELLPNQSQLLSNMVVLDNGRAVTRAGADQLDSNPSTFSNVTPRGAVQGMGFLDNFTNGTFLLVAEGGNLYTWSGSTWSNALAFTLTSPDSPFVAVQGVDQLLISDGTKHMQLWDGVNFTDCGASADTNAPIGVTVMAFIAGMYVVGGPAMVAGSGATVHPPDTLFFSNYLDATAGHWKVTNSFRVGNGDGEPIVGLGVIQSTASTTPIYNLAVLKSNSIWIVGIQPGTPSSFSEMPAAFFTSPQGDQIGTGIGCVGKNAFCLYQNDLLFMSQYGVQSLQRMQAAAGQYQLTSPLSLPIQPYIDRINWSAAGGIQTVKYKELAIFFVPLDGSTTNNYGLVWNGFIGQWMIWTGWTPQAAIVTRFNSVIELVLGNADGSVNKWKDAQNLTGLDSTYLDNGAPIPWQITTRSFVFGSLDFLKKARATLVRFNSGNATVKLSAYADLADEDDWTQNLNPGGAVLPVVLPFVLASSKPTPCYRSLEGLPYANEIYLTIGSNAGWASVRGLVISAFLKTLRDPNA